MGCGWKGEGGGRAGKILAFRLANGEGKGREKVQIHLLFLLLFTKEPSIPCGK